MNSYGDGNTYRGTVCKDSEVPTIITDGKTAYSGKDYPVHSSGPWSVTAGIVPDREGRLIVEDCSGNPVCATSARGVQGRVHIMEANAKLIAAAPVLKRCAGQLSWRWKANKEIRQCKKTLKTTSPTYACRRWMAMPM